MRDLIALQKIRNYLGRVRECYKKIGALSEEQLLELHESYALTQYLTNIHAIFQNIDDMEISSRLIIFSSRNIHKCRNISSHDYDSLNWVLVKRLCSQLLSLEISEILDTEIAKQQELVEGEKSIKLATLAGDSDILPSQGTTTVKSLNVFGDKGE